MKNINAQAQEARSPRDVHRTSLVMTPVWVKMRCAMHIAFNKIVSLRTSSSERGEATSLIAEELCNDAKEGITTAHRTKQQWTIVLIAWLCPYLICLLTSCAALQKPAQVPSRYQVTLAIAPCNNETEVASILDSFSILALDHIGSYAAFEANGTSGALRVMRFILPGENAVRQLQQQLQMADIQIAGFHIQKLN
jgi:hypothetical protein